MNRTSNNIFVHVVEDSKRKNKTTQIDYNSLGGKARGPQNPLLQGLIASLILDHVLHLISRRSAGNVQSSIEHLDNQ